MSPDQTDSLVFDASVTINFLGTGMAGRLVRLLEHRVTMADRTFREVSRHPIKDCDHAAELDDLIRTGHLQIETLRGASKDFFFELASDNLAGGLDDGEAAAIALAASKRPSAVVVTDDRKARNLLTRRWPQQRLSYSIDIFKSDRIASAMTRPVLADAVCSALRHARMRVPPHSRPWIIDLIGDERAAGCPSLGAVS
jgi:predicted nucleic acid-binding protein